MASIFADIHRGDVVALIGTCFGIYILGRQVANNLRTIRNDNRITPQPESPPEFFNASTEDTIAEETIQTLAGSPNPDMASAAHRMLVDRILRHPEAYSTLLGNARGNRGQELQEQALVSLKYLYMSAPQSLPNKSEFWYTLVAAMKRYLAVAQDRHADPVNAWKLRTQGERDGLMILGYELDSHATDIIKTTNLVRSWIAQYPFDGNFPHSTSRQRVVYDLISNQTDDLLLSRVLSSIHRVPIGRKHLRNAGLIGSAITEADMNADNENAVMSMTPPYTNDATNVIMPPESPRLDPLNTNEDEEARLRRRRRNAVVFDDTDTPDESEIVFAASQE